MLAARTSPENFAGLMKPNSCIQGYSSEVRSKPGANDCVGLCSWRGEVIIMAAIFREATGRADASLGHVLADSRMCRFNLGEKNHCNFIIVYNETVNSSPMSCTCEPTRGPAAASPNTDSRRPLLAAVFVRLHKHFSHFPQTKPTSANEATGKSAVKTMIEYEQHDAWPNEPKDQPYCITNYSSPSFRGRERSDRRFAPSEGERSPESITTGRAVMKVVTLRWHALLLGVMDSDKSARPICLRPGITSRGNL